ncbi:hypothetical protein JHK82_016029 [Glycine max]|nr:hypothetical protein JHK82_016029 [Glycine max]
MLLKEDGEIMSDFSSDFVPSSDEEEHEEEKEAEGDLFMVRRMLGSQAVELDECQRENIFHTRCIISRKWCVSMDYQEALLPNQDTKLLSHF